MYSDEPEPCPVTAFCICSSCERCLHPKDAKLGVSGLDLVASAHGRAKTEAEVAACVLGRDNAVVLGGRKS